MAGTKIEAYGKLYTGGDVKVIFLNLAPDGIDGIKFDRKQDKEDVYTMGSRQPVGRIHKEEKFTASMSVKAMVLDALEKVAPNGAINRIKPFEIGVSMLDEEEGLIKHYNLAYCEFKGSANEYKNDNGEIVHELELAIGDIQLV